MHKLMLSYAFSTKAYGIQYNAEWIDLFGKANFLIDTDVRAPENTDNFFGIGNTVAYDKNHHYFKANYNLYKLKTSLKWETHLGGSFSFGPAFQYYHYNPNKNNDRFIEDGVINYTYDRDIIDQDKYHIGLVADYEIDKRNDDLLPTKGIYLHSEFSGWKGTNTYSKNYLKFKGEFSFYKNLNPSETLILSNRIGGEVTAGDPTFYQQAYLGGDGNLLGYRQNRFAGKHSFYNNLEMRLAIADFGNLFFKGQLGLTGFFDVGRVWNPDEESSKWHNGVGGGLYFAPAYSLLLNFQMGYADEGWYPYFSLGLRF